MKKQKAFLGQIIEGMRMRLRPCRYRVVNDLTQEWFEVCGPDIRGCRIIADKECDRLGWKIENMRSEEL